MVGPMIRRSDATDMMATDVVERENGSQRQPYADVDILHEQLDSQGSAVYVEGLHMCMAARGVGAHEARLVTRAVRGVFLELATREEFIKLVTSQTGGNI